MSKTSQIYEAIAEEFSSEAWQLGLDLIEAESGTIYPARIPTEHFNPFDFDPTPFLPNVAPMSLPKFVEIAGEIIQDAQVRKGVEASKRVPLLEDFNNLDFGSIGDEVISWKVKERAPGKMNRDATGRPQRKGTYAYSLRSPKFPNKVIYVQSRPIDHKIEFNCWSKSAHLANERALWLEKLFIDHSWAFEVQGVERFYWLKRGPDTFWNPGGQRLHSRPLTFFVRFREFSHVAHPIIKTLNIQAQLTS